MTKRNIHSHQEHAPISKKQLQVTGYGEVRGQSQMTSFKFYPPLLSKKHLIYSISLGHAYIANFGEYFDLVSLFVKNLTIRQLFIYAIVP